jgi:hypothetical protein
MSTKDTYKSWRTTLFGLAVQVAIVYTWVKGVQPVEMWSALIFLAAFGLWFMPDTLIITLKNYFNDLTNRNNNGPGGLSGGAAC